MKPYFETDNGALYHGDCLEVMAQFSDRQFDLVLTDPPYGVKLNTDSRRFSGGKKGNIAKRGNGIGTANGKPIKNDDSDFDPTFLIKYGRCQIIWGWNNFPDKLPRGSCFVWLKRYDDAFGSFLSDAELAWFSNGHGVYCYRDLSNNSIANKRIHPTQKPVPLMMWCIEKSNTKGTILDPYFGSGSTGVACEKMGRKWVGIEIDKEYCERAAKRIERETRQMKLFDMEALEAVA